MSELFKDSMPQLLKEWLTWFEENQCDMFEVDTRLIRDNNLLQRTRVSLERNLKTKTFFDKEREMFDNEAGK